MTPSRTAVTHGMALGMLLALGACATSVEQTGPATPWYAYKSALTTRLWGASQVPPVATEGKGSIEAYLNPQTRLLSWTVTYSGLSGPVTGAHFHGPALAGENAPVVLPFTGKLSSPIQGVATLTPEQATDFLAGKWYVNLHTAANPGGELRGQIPAKP